ncbi:MAG: Mov34/MPN/PAD-1 family protein [Candidatus Rokubacteria bacterium]|nr:Mov34/MPN/PAD-1 family protein [Candidatus Rokubacteria bacterium]MBI2544693.1 Mov34/MPN/PAD-1 family protein [Candidatus Rokubacteria bacterium]
MILTRFEFRQIRIQAEVEYPSECCGVVLVRNGAPGERLLLPCRNVQDEFHAKDPEKYPRDSRTAYHLDPQNLLRIGRLEGDGYRVRTIYHSHIDAGAYFSETDKKNALLQGEPLYPEAAYVVVSVVEGKVKAAAAFVWNPEVRNFVPLELPALPL